jgi:hypothetical protein
MDAATARAGLSPRHSVLSVLKVAGLLDELPTEKLKVSNPIGVQYQQRRATPNRVWRRQRPPNK